MAEGQYKILFQNENKKIKPYTPEYIKCRIEEFGKGYNDAVREIMGNSDKLNKDTFVFNAARILNSFQMARSGPFQGVSLHNDGSVKDPKGNLSRCWDLIKINLLTIEKILNEKDYKPKTRTIVLLDSASKKDIILLIWQAFKKMLPITMGKTSFGLVGASKILFSVFPEIVLPVDNAQWLKVFHTVDLGDVISEMADEIIAWEKATGKQLQNCDSENPQLTLPGVFNVMAMRARKTETTQTIQESKDVKRKEKKSMTHGGPNMGREFTWVIDKDNAIEITKANGNKLTYSKNETISILLELKKDFVDDWFPLANNVQHLHNGIEQNGLGRTILKHHPEDITHAQGASYLGVVLEECGFLEWNQVNRGIKWRLIENVDPDKIAKRLSSLSG